MVRGPMVYTPRVCGLRKDMFIYGGRIYVCLFERLISIVSAYSSVDAARRELLLGGISACGKKLPVARCNDRDGFSGDL